MNGPTPEQLAEGQKHYAEMMRAIHDVSWHYAAVRVAVVGTQVPSSVIEAGEYRFGTPTDDDEFIEWAEALRTRKATDPMPKPRYAR